jgi:hypothetical protein
MTVFSSQAKLSSLEILAVDISLILCGVGVGYKLLHGQSVGPTGLLAATFADECRPVAGGRPVVRFVCAA